MVTGVHAIVYAHDADAARAFFRDVLGWNHVDAGGGWLIFAPPAAELAVHPAAAGEEHHDLWLMCDDVAATRRELEAKGVRFTQGIEERQWGLATAIEVPGAGTVGLYQPKHPVPSGSGKPGGRTGRRARSRPNAER